MSDPIASFQGLGTGINFRDLVDQIIQAESSPLRLVESRISQAEARNTAWDAFRERVLTLNTASEGLSDLSKLRTFNTSVANESIASVTANTNAKAGSFSLGVQQLATNEKMGSEVFASRDEALGLAGQFIVNGRVVTVTADQSLSDIASSMNSAAAAVTGSPFSAAVVGSADDGYRLVIASKESGALGLQLFDGATGILQTLGYLDASTTLRARTSDGAMSAGFTSASGTVGGQMGYASAPAGTVDIGGLAVSIDLATQSLQDIADAINTAASGAGSAVSASVVQDSEGYRLDVSGTTSFTDSNAVLESLGFFDRGRSAVQQQVQFEAFTDNNPLSVADGGTRLTRLWAGGADQNVTTGDTIELQGTRGDGTTFTKTFTVGATDTLQDLVDELNSATDGFQAGSRTATASIDAEGRIVVTDDEGGSSLLDLAIYTNNEGGGSLDFGAADVVATGRERELVAGQDAIFTVDGQSYTRSRNSVTGVIDGVTLNLTGVSEGETRVDVTRDVEVAADALQEFVDAMNEIQKFVNGEKYTDGEKEVDNPLFGDGVLRSMRTQLKAAFETTLGDLNGINRLGDIGVTIQRSGEYEFDRAKLTEALESDPDAVERLFQATGVGSTSQIKYVFAGKDTPEGTYAVDITQAATRAEATTSGFLGAYLDDFTADTLRVTHSDSGSIYEVSLDLFDTADDIVSELNAQFGSAAARELQASTGLYSDAGGTAATASTLLQDLYNSGGGSLGVANGDTITISGTSDTGASFMTDFSVTDVSTQTLDDLADAISSQVGQVEITVDNGLLTATSTTDGSRSFTISVTSDNAGGGSFNVGGFGEITAGRSAGLMSASVESGEIVIRAQEYGAGGSFDISYTAGGIDGTASLGLAAGSYTGLDIQGTIGGEAATGSGRTLTADDGTAADGLVISYTGADTGNVGELAFTRGIAALVEQMSDRFLKTGGSIAGVKDRISDSIDRYNSRVDLIQGRLDRRRAALIDQFTKLEASIAEIQARGSYMMSQLASLSAGNASGGLF